MLMYFTEEQVVNINYTYNSQRSSLWKYSVLEWVAHYEILCSVQSHSERLMFVSVFQNSAKKIDLKNYTVYQLLFTPVKIPSF